MTFSNCNDDELPVKPQISFQSISSTVTEGESVTVLFTIPLPAGVTPNYSLGGTATQGADYSVALTSNGLVFSTIRDNVQDPNETIIVTLTGFNGNAQLGGNLVHTITINEPPLEVEFATPSSLVQEGNTQTVAFKNPLPVGVVPEFILGGTASEGEDYTYSLTAQGLVFTTINDDVFDPDETIEITLTGVSGNAALGTLITHVVTITEPKLIVEFKQVFSTVTEGTSTTLEYNIELPDGVVPSISFTGTATEGEDFTYELTPLGIVLHIVDDGLYDPDETIFCTLTSISGNAELGDATTHAVTISESPLLIEFLTESSLIKEGETGTIAFNVPLPAGVVPTVTLSGTATLSVDYTYTITADGIEVSVTEDSAIEPNETIIITLTSVTGNTVLGSKTTHTVTLIDAPLKVAFVTPASTLSEGASATVAFTSVLPGDIIPVVSFSGTATLNDDYTYSITPQGVVITAKSDGVYDPNETIIITLTSVSGNAELGTQIVHTVTITEPPLVVEFASASSTAGEGNTASVTFNMTLPAGVTPSFTLGGTATSGTDYTYTLTPTGITFTLLADGLYDPNETILITLTGISGNAVLGTLVTHTLTITEPPLVVEFATASSIAEEGEAVLIAFNMTLPAGVLPTVSVSGTASIGLDYTYTITPEGIAVDVKGDGVYDPDETIIITLTSISGNAILGDLKIHTLTITELPLVIEFASAASTAAEGAEHVVAFTELIPDGVVPTFTLGGSATAGTDYTYTLTPEGISFTISADGIYDPNETIEITLTGSSGNTELGTQVSHVVTITEPAFIVEFDQASSSVAEGEDITVAFKNSLPDGVVPTLTISGTATPVTDFTYSITQTGVVISTIADGIYDPNETIIITLTSVSGNAELGTQIVHTVTITEPPLVVEFASASSSAGEGNTADVTFNITLPAGVTPSFTLGGTATSGTDYTYTLTPTGITFTLLADGLYDPNETILITLTGISGNAVIGTLANHTVTITEPPLVVEFATATSAAEEGDDVVIAFNMTLPDGVVPTVSLDGTATVGTDYSYTITPAGISISVLADAVYDPDETILVTLTGISGNATLGNITTHTLTITELPLVIEFATAASTAAEGAEHVVAFTELIPDGVVPTFTLGGSATAGTDYTYTLTPEGISFTISADGIYDPNETIEITLTGSSGNTELGTQVSHVVTITEPAFIVEFDQASSSVAEGEDITVAFKNSLPDGVVPTLTISGTATPVTDFTYSITQTGVVISTIADGIYDPNETIIITLTSVSGNAELGTQIVHTVTITEPPLVVEFASASSSAGEGNTADVTFNITLPAGVTPSFTLGGTATSGTDYTYTLTPTGITFTLLADGLYDPNETILITLTGISGNAVIGTLANHTVTITEPPLVVEFATATSAAEEGDDVVIAFNMTLPDGVVPTVSLDGTATVGTDYSYTITPAGISISVLADAVYDPDETILVTLTGISGNATLGNITTHTLTITELPLVIEFATAASTAAEGAEHVVAFTELIPDGVVPTFTLGGSATAGTDYTYTLTPEGIVFSVVDDGIYDPNETIEISLTGTSGNAELGTLITHTVTLTEPPLVVQFATPSTSAGEGNDIQVAFNLTLPDGVTPSLTFGGTATTGTDYTYTVTPTGINISLIDDGVYDPNETIIITLTGVSGNAELGTQTVHTVTITEPPLVVEFATTTSSAGEGNTAAVTFNMTLPAGVTPTFTLGGTATSGVDYTYTLTPSGISFTLIADGLYDPNETILITLTGVSGNAVLGTLITHTLTITEPPIVVEFATPTTTAAEGEVITVAFATPLPVGVTPSLSVGGSATAGTDYTYTVVAEGIQVTLLSDATYDPDETLEFTLTGASGNSELGTQITHLVTITEPPFIVEFVKASSSVAEGESITMSFVNPLPDGVVPTVSVTGTATQGTDFTYSITETGILINTIDDGIYDPNETIIVTLTGASGNTELGTITTHTLTITEPPLVVEFATATSSAEEGNTVTVGFTLELPSEVVPTFSLGGSATSGADYTYSLTSTGIVFTLLADGLYDPNETIVLTLTGISGNAVLGSTITHTITITEPPLVIEFEASSSIIDEGSSGIVAFSPSLPIGVVPTITVGGTAILNTDFTYEITAAGIAVTTLEDWRFDPDETIIFTLTALTGNTELGTQTVHTVTINDLQGEAVGFELALSTIPEGQSIQIAYEAPLAEGIKPLLSVSGTATLNADYTYSITSEGILVTALGDGIHDADETVIFTITGFTSNDYEIGTIETHTLTLTDVPFVVEFETATSTVTEGNDIVVMFSNLLPAGVTPIISLAGTATLNTDYSYSITPAGIVISTKEDWIYDPEEEISITLTGFSGNAALGTELVHTVTIFDPQGQEVEFESSVSVVAEGQGVLVLYSTPLPVGVTPLVAIGGSASMGIDYTYSFTPEGIQVNALTDGLDDQDETIIITMTGFTSNAYELGTVLTHTVTITDIPFVVEFQSGTSSLLEGATGLIAFTNPLPVGVTPTVSIAGTASQGADYTYSLTTSGVVVNTVEDWFADPDETVQVTLTSVTGNAVLGSTVIHTATIVDPPAPLVEFASTSSTVTEGQNITLLYTAPLPAGVTPTVSLGGDAILNVDYFYSFNSTGIVITAAGDGLFEADETITVTLTGFTANRVAELGTTLTHTVTIVDAPLVIEFIATGARRVEGTSAIAAFNQPLPPGVTPTFTITGTATSGLDYTYTQGQNSFVVTTKKDEVYEFDETVIIQLTGFTGNVIVGTRDTYTVTIEDEDEKATPRMQINLSWDSGNGTPGDVDMDLIFWYESAPNSFTFLLLSDNVGPTFEALTVPVSSVQDGKFGLSYVYYSGTSDNVTVNVNFRSYKGNINDTSNRAAYTATYTLANLNKWDQTQQYFREQFYNKVGNNYINMTGITVPASGSRVRAENSIVDQELLLRQSIKLKQ
jgi:hypothetical protein